ncbi:XTP/dITP diphosphatase [bacterium]|nr:XTP/dITP diphosphatase [bacterium]RIK73385.1 MAG: non-canonical purine NTP pyrophosphatase [candidate division KSB1 bacterium]
MPSSSRPARLVLATHNRDKIREMHDVLVHLPIAILSLDNFPNMPEVEEDGETLEDNAIKKALALQSYTGMPALADDTGLFVDALDGRPGVRSSRYAGEDASYQDNVRKLLTEMQQIPLENRQARFRTVMAFADGNDVKLVEGVCEGHIALAPSGDSGFGYDPVFVVEGGNRTLAEMTLAEKNTISHRGQALRAAKKILERVFKNYNTD